MWGFCPQGKFHFPPLLTLSLTLPSVTLTLKLLLFGVIMQFVVFRDELTWNIKHYLVAITYEELYHEIEINENCNNKSNEDSHRVPSVQSISCGFGYEIKITDAKYGRVDRSVAKSFGQCAKSFGNCKFRKSWITNHFCWCFHNCVLLFVECLSTHWKVRCNLRSEKTLW